MSYHVASTAVELQIPGGPAEGAALKLQAQDAAPAKKRAAKKKG